MPFHLTPVAKAIAYLIVGGVLGASIALVRMSGEWDRIALDNAALLDELERLAGELASRERALTIDQAVLVRSIEIEVDGGIPEHIRLIIESEARDLLQHLLGEEVDGLNPIFIEKSLSRTVEISQRELTIVPIQMRLGKKVLVRLQVFESGVNISH